MLNIIIYNTEINGYNLFVGNIDIIDKDNIIHIL